MINMVTFFLLEPGYAYSEENGATPEMIQEIARTVTVEQLREKCAEYGLTEIECTEGYKLDDFLEVYRNLPTDDLTCTFTDYGVSQSASGGGHERDVKEIIRRAFGILVLDECYKRKLAVSFIIA